MCLSLRCNNYFGGKGYHFWIVVSNLNTCLVYVIWLVYMLGYV